MKTKQPALPQGKFADRRKKKEPKTPAVLAKIAEDEKRRVAKLERDEPKASNPEYKGLALAALLVGSDPALAGFIAGLANVTTPDSEAAAEEVKEEPAL